MIKNIFLSITLLYSFIAVSQETFVKKIHLNWHENESVQISEMDVKHLPVVEGNGVHFIKMTPTFTEKWLVDSASDIKEYEIKNIVYKSISKKDIYDIPIENVATELDPVFNIISTRELSHAYLSINPLIKEGANINKVLSFEIHYSLKNNLKSARSYTNNSVLSSGKWYKFSVDTTGIYKLDKDFLEKLGIDTKKIDPKKISIYGNGGNLLPYKVGDFRHDDLQENGILVEGEADGKFDANDYVLFYAKGPESWRHEGTLESLHHVKNIYTDKAYYFVHINSQNGKRVQTMADNNSGSYTTLTNYDAYFVHELDKKNLFQIGRRWVGESFDVNPQKYINVKFSGLDTSFPVNIRTMAVASSQTTTYMNVSIGAQEVYNMQLNNIPHQYTLATDKYETKDVNLTSENFTIKLDYNNSGNPAAHAYLDYIEIIGKKKLNVTNKQFTFRNFEMLDNTGAFSFTIQNASKIYKIWDVTNSVTPKNIHNLGSGGVFSFKAQGGELREYVVLNNQDYYQPEAPKDALINNQNLHALSNVDYVIITKDFLANEAEVIAQYHRDNNNLNVVVASLEQIYNEFGSGAPDITAIRDFVKFLYDTSSPHLQYIMMYGDASYDFKNIYENTDNIVPAFESYESFSATSTFVTDDYFAIVSDNEEGELDGNIVQTQDVAIARVPIRTIQEARDFNLKVLNYYKEVSLGDWRNQIAIMADDPDSGTGMLMELKQEQLSDQIKLNKRVFNIKKLYADAYKQVISASGAEYPEAKEAIINSVEKGVLVLNYFGHGGEDGLATEKLLTVQDIANWTNIDKLPLIMIISCEFARFDNPSRPNTAGEVVVRNPRGAGVHQIATARAIWVSTGGILNEALIPPILEYDGTSHSISEVFRRVKNEKSGSAGKQRYFVFSFGDPAMKLAVPKPDISITHMNSKPINQPLDTIKALSHVSFKGIVKDASGNIETDFNGKLSVIVFDKEIDKQTLVNDGIGTPMVFDTQESKIFRGSATVTNGQFSFDFVAPKDIRPAYGKGKLSFYADNRIKDKNGYNIDVTVGGINENAPEDNEGPVIQLYMNDKSFVEGGTTSQSPLFLAFLEDENGINTSLTSIDHDIVATLDNDQQNPMILNDYYTTELNNYKKGSLEYRLRNLEVGPHTIHLKAYDTYNNKSEASLNFVVLDDNQVVLEHVLNYPNPFVNYTEFWFNHNKPNEPLEVQVQIYTVSGKLVKTINKLVQNTGSLSRDISWDGLDDFGQKIGKGVYVFKLSVKATLSNLKAEKFEKLVILQ